jgi:hypothetical protein
LVTAQTRSGSNRWHGNGYEIYNSSEFYASPPNLNNPNLSNNPTKINTFGAAVGGPLVKDRLFLFGDLWAEHFRS